MTKYRKRPLAVEAVQFKGWRALDESNWPAWFLVALDTGKLRFAVSRDDLMVETDHGRVWAQVGSWIIRAETGEVYPCAPDVFEKTYYEVRPCICCNGVPRMNYDCERCDGSGEEPLEHQ